MKIARYAFAGATHIGIVDGQTITALSERIAGLSGDMIALISHWRDLEAQVRALPHRPDLRLSEVRLLAPVARPGKVLGIGLNYADHVAESGIATPEYQTWFTKAVTSINGPYDPIQLPKASSALDYEGELVYIIGSGGRQVPRAAAHTAIFGYCVGNDVSVRDWQFRSGQFMIGKSFDTHAPIGPWVVTADDIDARNLPIRTFVNDEKRQESNTHELIFDCADQVAYLSQAMTLEAGDVIFTGTPGGVGAVMRPPKYMAAGDRVRVEIDGIGAIENQVVAESGCRQ